MFSVWTGGVERSETGLSPPYQLADMRVMPGMEALSVCVFLFLSGGVEG